MPPPVPVARSRRGAACNGSSSSQDESPGDGDGDGDAPSRGGSGDGDGDGDGDAPSRGGSGDGDGDGDGDASSGGGSGDGDGDTSPGGQDSGDGGSGGLPDSGSECEDLDLCGGDFVGEWNYVSFCFGPHFFTSCPEVEISGSGTIEGTLTASNDSMTTTATTTFLAELVLPLSCLEGTPCDEAFAGLGSQAGTTVTTEVSDGLCTVHISQPPFESSTTRSIQIEEPLILEGSSRETEYCQEGDTLRIRPLNDNPFGIIYTLERTD